MTDAVIPAAGLALSVFFYQVGPWLALMVAAGLVLVVFLAVAVRLSRVLPYAYSLWCWYHPRKKT